MISGRTLLLSLFALNLFVFLWLIGLLPITGKSERQPARLSNEIEPDKLEIVRPAGSKQVDRAPATEPTAAEAGAGSIAAGAGVAELTVPGTAAGDPAVDPVSGARTPAAGVPGLSGAASQLARAGTPVGTEISPAIATVAQIAGEPELESMPAKYEQCVLFPESDYRTAVQQMERFAPSLATASLRRLDSGSYLVYLEPLASADEARTRRRELIANGLKYAQVIVNGERRNGLSLGLVRTAEQADIRLRELRLLGVDDAVVGPLSATTARYRTELRADPIVIEQSVRPATDRAGLTLEPC